MTEDGVVDCKYFIRGKLGKGRGGGAVYRAEPVKEPRDLVAVKYPASHTELNALRALEAREPRCLGVPRLLHWGEHRRRPYLVTELLGATLADVFRQLWKSPLAKRWPQVQLLGRMVLRRLEALHRCGYVHGDVSPGNVLCGETGGGGTGLFLVDFGCARPFPGGEPVMAFWSTVEFDSIRVVDNRAREPYDDLESLAYLLCHGVYGELPWFKWARSQKKWEGPGRDEACQKVREAKSFLLWGQWSMLGLEWLHFMEMPVDLRKFLLASVCRRDAEDGLPDYGALAALLGAKTDDEADQVALKEVLELLEL